MNKKFTRVAVIIVIAVAFIFSSSIYNSAAAQGRPGVSYQDFYDELSPYGEWVDYPDYGYVWVPDAGSDFQPYSSGGRWVWSDDYDWMWVSDYDWGWAPFHYGRWFQDPGYGWMWMPGYEWSPAWVAWRDGGDYYGWAPLRPGINISIGISLGGYNPPVNYWSFAPRRYIGSYGINRYCIDRSRNVTIINNTTIINNYGRRGNNIFVNGGPGRRDAERYAGRITPIRFSESSRPGRDQYRGNRVSMYRPEVRRDDNHGTAPRNFNRYDRERSTADRSNGNREGVDRSGERGYSSRDNRQDNRNDGRRNGVGQSDRGQNTPGANENGGRRDVFNRPGREQSTPTANGNGAIRNDNGAIRNENGGIRNGNGEIRNENGGIRNDNGAIRNENGGRRDVFNRPGREQNTPPTADNSGRYNRRNDDRVEMPGRNDNQTPVRRNVFERSDRVERPNMEQRRQPVAEEGQNRRTFDRPQRSAEAPQQRVESPRTQSPRTESRRIESPRSESPRMGRSSGSESSQGRSTSESSQSRSSEGRRSFGRRG